MSNYLFITTITILSLLNFTVGAVYQLQAFANGDSKNGINIELSSSECSNPSKVSSIILKKLALDQDDFKVYAFILLYI